MLSGTSNLIGERLVVSRGQILDLCRYKCGCCCFQVSAKDPERQTVTFNLKVEPPEGKDKFVINPLSESFYRKISIYLIDVLRHTQEFFISEETGHGLLETHDHLRVVENHSIYGRRRIQHELEEHLAPGSLLCAGVLTA